MKHYFTSILNYRKIGKQLHLTFAAILILFSVTQVAAQTCTNFSYNLDQGKNGSSASPINPVEWTNQNLNSNAAHYVEGHVVPYRAILSGLDSGLCYCIQIEWDIRHSSVNALDYITSYPNCTNTLLDQPSHQGSFLHDAECVDPLDGLTLVNPTLNYFPIPVPTNNLVVLGSSQPETSFNAQQDGETDLAMFNGLITSATYLTQGSLVAAQSATSLELCFIAQGEEAVLAWGGHIASRLEWGVGHSAGSISGAPYHMRVLGMKCCFQTSFTGGNQDRSLQANAVIPAPIAHVVSTDTLCTGGTNTHLVTTNEPGASTYSWEITDAGTTGAQIITDDTLQQIQVSTTGPGEYIICGTITINGVSDSDCDTITVLASPVCSISGDSLVCNGSSTTFTASGGSTYLWNTGETTAAIEVSTTGTYTVTITDDYGCSSFCDKPLTAASPFSLDFDVTDVFCFGDATGAINLNILGGGVGLEFLWSNAEVTEDLTGLTAGTYTVTVTDENGCSISGSAEINEPEAALEVQETHIDASCFDGADGSIDLTISGGTPPYDIDWSNGASDEDINNLEAGSYDVLVTDFFGCTASLNVAIEEPSAVSITEDHENVACNGGNDGSIDLTISGGTPDYSFLWNDGNTDEDRSALSSGMYTVTVTDDNGCTAIETISITQAGSLEFDEIHSDVSCFGGNDGSIDVTISGGTPGYFFLWNDGNTDEDRSGLAAGSYTVTVTDANGCSIIEIMSIEEPDELVISEQHTDAACYGNSNGSIALTINGGTFPYSFNWSNGSTDEDQTGLIAGNYTVTVTDDHGCTASETIEITEPDELLITGADITDVSCKDGDDGAIDMTVEGGTPDYIFSWSNGGDTEDISGLSAGNYNVTVMDANGCSTYIEFTIEEPELLEVSENNIDITCFDADNGSIELTVTGGTLPYSFDWSNGAATEDLSDLAPGTYTVTVSDNHGCTASLFAEITEPALLQLFEQHEDATCNENNDGGINLGVSGGSPDYTYDWSNGATVQDISGLAAGTYTVTVTDDHGCSASTSVTINEPDLLELSSTQVDVLCNGNSTGSADLTVNGGTPDYTFEWSNGATTEDVSDLSAGTYTVTVTDENGCSATTSVTITEPASLLIDEVIINSTCGGASGSIDITVSGGNDPYTFEWINGATTEDISDLAAGTYTVTVTDENSCSATESFNITDAGAVQANAVGTDATCNGGSNGSADLTVSGGTPPYDFEWNNGATTEDVSGLEAGTYTVTVTDQNGCTAIANVIIDEPAAIEIVAEGVCSPCKKKGEAYASASATGGTGILTYLWSTSETTQVITNLESGTYTVTVTDENGCTAVEEVILDCDPKCQYTTFTMGGWGSEPSGNNPGTYLHANFANAYPNGIFIGCDNTLVLTSPQAVTDFLPSGSTASLLPVGTLTNPGGAYTNVLAGQLVAASLNIGFDAYDPNFSAEPGNLADLEIASGDFAGWTVAQLLDSANNLIGGCGSLYSETQFNDALSSLNETFDNGNVNLGYLLCPSEELIAYIESTDVSCDKICDGTAEVFASLGTAPYTYQWSTGATTAAVTGLCEGTYTVTVTDANDCQIILSVEIGKKSAQFNFNFLVTDNTCNGAGNGMIDLTVIGGSAPYQYEWSNGETTEDISNLDAATYTVTVTDNNGCTSSDQAQVGEPDLLALIIVKTDIACAKDDNGSANLTVSGGVGEYSFLWSNGATTEDITGLVPGIYTVTVTDGNDCTASATVEILEISSWMYINFSVTHAVCHNAATGAINATITGGVAPYTYQWSNGATTEDISNLVPAFYTITVTDANGCSNTNVTYINNPSAISASVVKVRPVCGINGSIDLTVTGGSSPYSFLWSTGATTEDISGLTPGYYTVTITDNKGCLLVYTTRMWGASAMKIRKLSLTHTSDNVCDGAIDIKVNYGTPPYTYLWSNGATTQDIGNLCAGYYKVTVTDAQGCVAKKTWRIQYLKDVIPTRVTEESYSNNNGISLLNVYPNPASETTNVRILFDKGGDAEISILNIDGKLVQMNSGIPAQAGVVMDVTLDVNELSSGFYLLKVVQNGVVVHDKLQIIK